MRGGGRSRCINWFKASGVLKKKEPDIGGCLEFHLISASAGLAGLVFPGLYLLMRVNSNVSKFLSHPHIYALLFSIGFEYLDPVA